MDATAPNRAMELLGRFNDEMTHAFDEAFGTRWAEIEDILAIAAIVVERPVTTRRLSELSGLDRRAVSRMVARLRTDGLVTTRASQTDGRAVEVVLTPRGERRAQALRTTMTAFFRRSTSIAREISEGMLSPHASRVPTPSADPIELLRRVCEAGVALVHVMPDAATEGTLAARQRAALVQIATQGLVRPNDLTPALGVSRAGVAYIVDQLCAKGFVDRRRDALPEDRRAVVLEATAEGRHAVEAVLGGIEQQRETLAELFAEVAAWDPPGSIPGRPLSPGIAVRDSAAASVAGPHREG